MNPKQYTMLKKCVKISLHTIKAEKGSVGKKFLVTGYFEDISLTSENLVVLRKSLITSQTLNSDYDYNNDGMVNIMDLVRLKKKLST